MGPGNISRLADVQQISLHTGLIGELFALESALDDAWRVLGTVRGKMLQPVPEACPMAVDGTCYELPTMRVAICKDRVRRMVELIQEIDRELGE